MLNKSRIILRQLTTNDATECIKWFCSQEVMKNCFGGFDKNEIEVIERIKRYKKHYEKYGFSKMGIQLISTNELIGDAGFMSTDIKEEIDIGYRLRRDKWGQGYASEAVIQLIDYWRINKLSKRLIALTEPENSKSIKLLLRNGFEFHNIVFIQNKKMKKYYLKI